ncbi:twin-arginine translocase TatA/TatE family subunit [Corallococcus terminator]
MLGLKPMELFLIIFVLLLLFGATRLPQLGSSLGSAIRNFKRGFGGDEETGTPGADKKGTGTLAGGGNVDNKDVKSSTPSSHA